MSLSNREGPRPMAKNGVKFEDDLELPEKLREDEEVDFKKRQRRRSSLTPLTVAGLPKAISSSGRRASTVSSASSCMCKYVCVCLASSVVMQVVA